LRRCGHSVGHIVDILWSKDEQHQGGTLLCISDSKGFIIEGYLKAPLWIGEDRP
jgi:hypothetical protein